MCKRRSESSPNAKTAAAEVLREHTFQYTVNLQILIEYHADSSRRGGISAILSRVQRSSLRRCMRAGVVLHTNTWLEAFPAECGAGCPEIQLGFDGQGNPWRVSFTTVLVFATTITATIISARHSLDQCTLVVVQSAEVG